MTDVLTREEYVGVANEMTFPASAWINGKFTSARSGETYDSTNPTVLMTSPTSDPRFHCLTSPAGRVAELHLPVSAPCLAHPKNARLKPGVFILLLPRQALP